MMAVSANVFCFRILNQSAVCAKQRVSGCDKCQRDTVDTLVAKVNRQLEDTCRAPPVSPCKAVQAYKCKDVLASFRVSGTASSSNDGLLCMYVTVLPYLSLSLSKKKASLAFSFSIERNIITGFLILWIDVA